MKKFVISIAGTHGKSTTTILMGLVLENAKLIQLLRLVQLLKVGWGVGGGRVLFWWGV